MKLELENSLRHWRGLVHTLIAVISGPLAVAPAGRAS